MKRLQKRDWCNPVPFLMQSDFATFWINVGYRLKYLRDCQPIAKVIDLL
jgi:hypothetical protein